MNRIIQWACLLALLAVSVSTKAACDAVGSFTLNPGSIIVQRDVTVGQPFTDWIYSNSGMAYQNCSFDGQLQYDIENGIKSYNGRSSGLSYNGETVFDTNLPGVGFVLEGNAQSDSQGWSGWQGIRSGATEQMIVKTPHNSGDKIAFTDQARIRLIKTGNIQSGALNGSVGYFYGGIRETTSWNAEPPISFAGGTITSVACTVTSQEPVSVPLGEHDKSEFGGVGSSTGWTAFDIGLQCDKDARINVRIDATQDVSGITGVMRLDNDQDAASGVGVELWYQHTNTPVAFGQVLSNYWTSSGGAERVQLQARYRQTAETVTAGAANATATFTLTYQ